MGVEKFGLVRGSRSRADNAISSLSSPAENEITRNTSLVDGPDTDILPDTSCSNEHSLSTLSQLRRLPAILSLSSESRCAKPPFDPARLHRISSTCVDSIASTRFPSDYLKEGLPDASSY